MEQPVHTLLARWESFYIIIIAGSVAGALIGLQFVVIALIAESRSRPTPPEIAAFGTPTILHFCAALLLEDWVWHAALPFLAYAVLLAAAVLLPRHSGPALSLVATVTLGLVFIGIHNAWDTITYIAVDPRHRPDEAETP